MQAECLGAKEGMTLGLVLRRQPWQSRAAADGNGRRATACSPIDLLAGFTALRRVSTALLRNPRVGWAHNLSYLLSRVMPKCSA